MYLLISNDTFTVSTCEMLVVRQVRPGVDYLVLNVFSITYLHVILNKLFNLLVCRMHLLVITTS